MSYEQDGNKEEYIHDIFNAEGTLVAKKSIGVIGGLGQFLNHLRANARNNRYYRIRFKEEGGFAELIVYRMIWQ